MNETKTCCFIGHREIHETEELEQQVYRIVEKLILEENVDTFLFGSKSRFNRLCYEQVTGLQTKYPHIKRIYVRAEFPVINDDYRSYLLENYEQTYYPQKLVNAGRAVYVERNCEMIDQSSICIFYYRDSCAPKKRKSGTKTALEYAMKQNKRMIQLQVE